MELSLIYDENKLSVIEILSVLPDYKVAYLINKTLKHNYVKLPHFITGENQYHALYFNTSDKENFSLLITEENGASNESMKRFLLFLNGSEFFYRKENIINSLIDINDFFTVSHFKRPVSDSKKMTKSEKNLSLYFQNIDNMLFDLETHFMELSKNKKIRY